MLLKHGKSLGVSHLIFRPPLNGILCLFFHCAGHFAFSAIKVESTSHLDFLWIAQDSRFSPDTATIRLQPSKNMYHSIYWDLDSDNAFIITNIPLSIDM